MEVHQVQHTDENVDGPVQKQRQVLAVRTVQKTVDVPQFQFLDKGCGHASCQERQCPNDLAGP